MSRLGDARGSSLDVLFVGGDPDEAPRTRDDALAVADRVVHFAHRGLGDDPSPDRLVVLCEHALSAVGVGRGDPVLVLLPAGTRNEEIAARLAVRRGGVALGRCLDIVMSEGAVTGVRRAAFGGRLHVSLRPVRGPCFGTYREIESHPRTNPVRNGPARTVHRVDLDDGLPPCDPIRREPNAHRMRPLEGARIVVSGGRGVQSEEGYASIRALADCLGAAVGGSLPAVDSGWVPVAHQVGQSGKFVSPLVYVAVGISGTPQHMAGIAPDTRIVAVNSDAEAAIFRMAEVGVVADAAELLPRLIDRLRMAATGDS